LRFRLDHPLFLMSIQGHEGGLFPVSHQEPDENTNPNRQSDSPPGIFMYIVIGYPCRNPGFVDYSALNILQIFLGAPQIVVDLVAQRLRLSAAFVADEFHQFLSIGNNGPKVFNEFFFCFLGGLGHHILQAS
jgi:hypothetical protein